MDLPQLAYHKYGAGPGALRETGAVAVSVHHSNLWELSEAAGGPQAGCVRQRRHRLWGAVWLAGRTLCHSHLGEYSTAGHDFLKDGSAGGRCCIQSQAAVSAGPAQPAGGTNSGPVQAGPPVYRRADQVRRGRRQRCVHRPKGNGGALRRWLYDLR